MVRTRSYLAVFTVMAVMVLLLMLPSVALATPANDNFADAQTIRGQTASVDGTNVGATIESGDPPSVAGVGTSHTVWYRWTAPFSGPVRMDTCTSNFDTVLGVFTGSALGSLTERVGSDDACGYGSEVRFNATENTTYQILVDGYSYYGDGEQGTFTLRVNLSHKIDCRRGQAVCAGTETSDRITGTRSKDNIRAGGGEDQIFALGANDVAIGGAGNDVINGYDGQDKLYGGDGDDVIYTGGLDEDKDSVYCGEGWDKVWRERGKDTVAVDCEDVRRYGSGGGGGY
jgi:hypothetical protein